MKNIFIAVLLMAAIVGRADERAVPIDGTCSPCNGTSKQKFCFVQRYSRPDQDTVCVKLRDTTCDSYYGTQNFLCDDYPAGQDPAPQIQKAKAAAKRAESFGLCTYFEY